MVGAKDGDELSAGEVSLWLATVLSPLVCRHVRQFMDRAKDVIESFRRRVECHRSADSME